MQPITIPAPTLTTAQALPLGVWISDQSDAAETYTPQYPPNFIPETGSRRITVEAGFRKAVRARMDSLQFDQGSAWMEADTVDEAVARVVRHMAWTRPTHVWDRREPKDGGKHEDAARAEKMLRDSDHLGIAGLYSDLVFSNDQRQTLGRFLDGSKWKVQFGKGEPVIAPDIAEYHVQKCPGHSLEELREELAETEFSGLAAWYGEGR